MDQKKLPEETGLGFYSRVSASISHELKNSLAVINESAGFLEDLTLMVQKGVPLDPVRLSTLAGTILKQVQRSNGIIKNMNRLAHSLDEKRSTVDLVGLLDLMMCLAERTAVTRGVRLSGDLPASPITVTSHPFFLETLIWLLIELALTTCGSEKTVIINVADAGSGAHITFSGLAELTEGAAEASFAGRMAPLLKALRAGLEIDAGGGRLVVTLPQTLSVESDE